MRGWGMSSTRVLTLGRSKGRIASVNRQDRTMHRDTTGQRVGRSCRSLVTATIVMLASADAASHALARESMPSIASFAASEADAAARREGLSLDEAIDRAQKRFRARVVRAEQTHQDGRVVYVLRLLSDEDGRVFTVSVDAATGTMQ